MVTISIKSLVLKQIVGKISGEQSVLKKSKLNKMLEFHCNILKWVFSNCLWGKNLGLFSLQGNLVNIL